MSPLDAFATDLINTGCDEALKTAGWIEQRGIENARTSLLGNLPMVEAVIGVSLAKAKFKVINGFGGPVDFPPMPPQETKE